LALFEVIFVRAGIAAFVLFFGEAELGVFFGYSIWRSYMFVFNWEIFGAADMAPGWALSPPGG
jgi:hypothetical protein